MTLFTNYESLNPSEKKNYEPLNFLKKKDNVCDIWKTIEIFSWDYSHLKIAPETWITLHILCIKGNFKTRISTTV